MTQCDKGRVRYISICIHRRNLRGYEGSGATLFRLGYRTPTFQKTGEEIVTEAICGDGLTLKPFSSQGCAQTPPGGSVRTPPARGAHVSPNDATFSPPELVPSLFRPKLRPYLYTITASIMGVTSTSWNPRSQSECDVKLSLLFPYTAYIWPVSISSNTLISNCFKWCGVHVTLRCQSGISKWYSKVWFPSHTKKAYKRQMHIQRTMHSLW